jgi:small ligand-binding sensory domain FIST
MRISIQHITQAEVRGGSLSVSPADGHLLFTDPFRIDADSLLAQIARVQPGIPMIGGITGGQDRDQHTFMAIDDMPVTQGAVLVGVQGIDLVPIVSQACEPIGEAWLVTEVEGNAILRISGRPAIDVLIETVAALTPREQREARRHLLVGFALDEYHDEFVRGDFLIRDVLGMDHARAAIRVGYHPRPGQTIQFQMRDPVTADIDLHQHLLETRASLGARQPLAAVLLSCAGRGSGLFGRADHDALAVHAAFGGLPVAGFSSLGEIVGAAGPPVLHSYTATVGLLVPRT